MFLQLQTVVPTFLEVASNHWRHLPNDRGLDGAHDELLAAGGAHLGQNQ